MTFTEAAVEVLRLVGKPLHYKKITEIAIERNLLSHVGKTPETTMSSRLATMVKKDRGDAPIVKVKPGVFALREFSPEAAADTGDLLPESDAPEASEALDQDFDLEDEAETREEQASFGAQELPGADLFPEEEDDDELILANLDEETREGRRSRKRRSRRRRERDFDATPRPEEPRHERSAAVPVDRPRREREREERAPEAPASRAAGVGEPTGRDLSDAIETALRSRGRQPRTLVQVAEILIEGGRLTGSPGLLAPTLAAAIRGDNAKRRASGKRPRFRKGNGLLSLLEWDLPNESVNAERDAVRAADRQRQSIQRALVRRLRDLPDGALLELLATWLNAIGVHSLHAVRADAGDFNLAGTLRRGPEEMPLAITIYRGRQPIDKEAVVALRGGLHRFDHARVGWVITLGQVLEGTVAEARAEGAAPCAVFDGDALALSMEEVGVGIQRCSLPIAVLDVELLDSLAGVILRSGGATAMSDDNAEPSSNERRRRRRRGRRRGFREEASENGPRGERIESQERAPSLEQADSEPPEDAEGLDFELELSEDTEQMTPDPASFTEAELDEV
jgi:hypothetical protein